MYKSQMLIIVGQMCHRSFWWGGWIITRWWRKREGGVVSRSFVG